MTTQNTNFKTISGKTQNYDFFQMNPLKKYYILWFYLFNPPTAAKFFFEFFREIWIW